MRQPLFWTDTESEPGSVAYQRGLLHGSLLRQNGDCGDVTYKEPPGGSCAVVLLVDQKAGNSGEDHKALDVYVQARIGLGQRDHDSFRFKGDD